MLCREARHRRRNETVPETALSNVVFPEPLLPTSPTNSPALTVSATSLSALTPPNRTDRSRTSRTTLMRHLATCAAGETGANAI